MFKLAILCLIFIPNLLFSNIAKKNILVITSYHNFLPWDISYSEGLMEESKKYKDIIVYKENLDSIRFKDTSNEGFYNYLKVKYKNIKFDGVISESDPAHHFVEEKGKSLFGDIPYVFYSSAKKISTFSKKRAITNGQVIKNTLNYAFRENNNIKEIIIIDQERHNYLEKLSKSYNKNILIKNMSDSSLDEILNEVSKIKENAFIFYTIYFEDKNTKTYSPLEILEKIYKKSEIPIYSIYSTYINSGIVGGELIDARKTAKESIIAMKDLLSNDNTYKTYLSTTSIFNNDVLNKFDLNRDFIPKDAIIINKKKNIFEEYFYETISFLFILFISIVFLIINIYLSFHRKKLIRKIQLKNIKDKRERLKKVQAEKLLIQYSKMNTLSNILKNIASQWKQPLNIISSAASYLHLNRNFENRNKKLEEESLEKILASVSQISDSLNLFKNFFKPSNKKELFNIKDVIQTALYLNNLNVKDSQIHIIENLIDCDIHNYRNEFLQVLLNIIDNAKNALENNDNEKIIFINSFIKNNQIIVTIKDNAKGINENIINDIFKIYFSTKHSLEDKRINLYMCKEIITEYMKGSIEVENKTYIFNKVEYTGANFIISLPLKE